MSEPEIRHDVTIDCLTIIAPHRAMRPKKMAETSCPFCPGNEDKTPPASLIYSRIGSEIVKLADSEHERVRSWLVRCFPNMFPALRGDVPFEEKCSEALFFAMKAYRGFGYHEIIVESPDHRAHPPNSTLRQMELVMEAYFEVVTRLSYERNVRYVCLFRNYKSEAGASISHPHSQVIALPLVPPTIKRKISASRRYNRERGGCMYCDLIELEAGSPRLIYADDYYVALAPWASAYPYEFWIIPRRHEPSFINTYPKERRNLAKVLKATLTALKRILNDPPYNLSFNVAPPRWRGESYHWHVEVHPRLTTLGGFELATGAYINIVQPEKAAEEFRLELEKIGY